MPSEITLGESMRVRCSGRVLRVVKPADSAETAETRVSATKIGVAVCLKGYEYLPATEEGSADYRRVSALHRPGEPEISDEPAPASPRATAH